MAVTTIIDDERKLVVHRLQGELQLEDIILALRKFYSSESVPDYPILWDLQEASLLSLELDEIQKFSDATKSFWPSMKKGKTALLVTSEGDFGIARMFQILSEGIPREIKVLTNPIRIKFSFFSDSICKRIYA